jgi:phytanoyl-CoA hydroxylase
MVNCWIALDDTQLAGALELVRYSHQWSPSKPDSNFHGPRHYRKAMEQAARNENRTPDIFHVKVPAGGASFHHGWVWHGSGKNNTDTSRRALVLHGISSAAEFVPNRLHEGNGPIYSRYRLTNSTYLDTKYFPILWTQT